LRARIAALRDEFAQERSLRRLGALGVRVIEGEAAFTSAREMKAGEQVIRARRFVLATGRKSPASSVTTAGAGTPLSAFLGGGEVPRAVLVTGEGSQAVVLAQILARGGVGVALNAGPDLLAGVDCEAVALLHGALLASGVRLIAPGSPEARDADLLPRFDVSTFPPVIDGLSLDRAGIAVGKGEIILDHYLRSSNPRVYAIGSITSEVYGASPGPAQIGYLVARLLLKKPGAWQPGPSISRIAAEPEIITFGVSEADARRRTSPLSILRESIPGGFVKVLVNGKGRILGGTIIGETATALAAPWLLAMSHGGLEALSRLPPLPGLPADSTRVVSAQPQRKLLTSPRLQGLVRFFRKFS
jgi:pyruvate/2-oxoglutarate dehydrogenase complex dihydrolipoamide dehydrogenase (E3) component